MEPVTLKLSPETSLHQVMGKIPAVGRPGPGTEGRNLRGKLSFESSTHSVLCSSCVYLPAVEGTCSPHLSTPQSQGCWDTDSGKGRA